MFIPPKQPPEVLAEIRSIGYCPIKSVAEKIADSLHQARRFDDLPQSLQLARVNGKVMKGELSSADGMRKIAQIRARFDGLILDI